jgi:hypothetical protein
MNVENSNIIQIADHFKGSEHDIGNVLNNIDLIRKGLFMSVQHLHVMKTTFITSKLLKDFGTEKEIENLKIQQTALIKSMYDTFKGLLEIINYPLNKPSIFNIKNNNLENCVDVLINDIEYLIENNNVLEHKPKNLFPVNKYTNYFINHVDNIDTFGKSLNNIIKTIKKYVSI